MDADLNVSVLMGSGDGTFEPAASFSAGGGGTGSAIPGDLDIAIGPLNSDGFADLVLANASFPGRSNVAVALGNGDGTFRVGAIFGEGDNPYSVAVADFDRDGNFDLLAANRTLEVDKVGLHVRAGKGDGNFGESLSVPDASLPSAVVTRDLDNDGLVDIAAASDDGVTVFLGKGDGSFKTVRIVESEKRFESVVAGDLNHDGFADLVIVESDSGDFVVLPGRGRWD